MQKITKILSFIGLLAGIVVSAVFIFCFRHIEDMILFFDKQMWDKYPQVTHEPINGDYPISSYLKDVVIYIGLYKDMAIFSCIFFVVLILVWLFFHKKVCRTV